MTVNRIRHVCGWFSVLMGLVAIVGWLTQQPALTYLIPGNQNSMKFNTALCFIGLGLALILAKKRGIWARRIRETGVIFVLGISGLTLLQYWGNWNLGIDQLVVKDTFARPNTGFPGRISDQAAYTFLLLGTSYELIQSQRSRWINLSQVLLLIATWITLVGLFGYVLHIQAFFQFLDRTSTIALNTILGFLAVCLGLLCLSSNQGLMVVITSPQSGGQLARQLIPWILLTPLGLNWLTNTLAFQQIITQAFGDGLVALTTSTIFLGLIWYVARNLNQQEAELEHRIESDIQANRRFRQIVIQSPFPMVLHRSDGKVVELNQAWEELSGYQLSEIPTVQAWCALVSGATMAPQMIAKFDDLFTLEPQANIHLGEFTIRAKDGKHLVWDFYSSALGPDYDGYFLVLTTAVNITERYLAEQQLNDLSQNLDHLVKVRTAELELIREELETAQRIAHMGNWVFDVAKQEISWSEEVFRIFGMAPNSNPPSFEEHLAQIHPQDRAVWQETVEQALIHQRPYDIDFRCVWPDGSVHWVNGHGEVETDAAGKTVRLFGVALDITARKEAEQRLAETQVRFRLLVEQSPGVVYVSAGTAASDHSYVSPQVQDLLGVPAWTGGFFETWKKYIYSEDRDWVIQAINEAMRHHHPFNLEYRMVGADGKMLWVRDQGEIFTDPIDGTFLIQGLAVDITALKNAEAALQKQIQDLDQRNQEMTLLRQLSDFLQACQDLAEAAEVIASFVPQLFPGASGQLSLVNPDHKDKLTALIQWGNPCHTSETFTIQDCWALRRGSPHLYSPQHQGTPLTCRHLESHESEDICIFCLPMVAFSETIGQVYLESQYSQTQCSPQYRQLAETMTEQISLSIANLKLREALRQESLRDPLTGLYNRRYLHEFLRQEFARSQRSQNQIGLLMLDIDHFKHFNDEFGHSVGDLVLQEVANTITRNIRPSDVACRYGGEELIVVMPNANLAAVQGRAEQLREAVSRQHTELEGQQIGGITVSIGVAVFPEAGQTQDALLKAADNALYQAKEKGRNRVVVSTSS